MLQRDVALRLRRRDATELPGDFSFRAFCVTAHAALARGSLDAVTPSPYISTVPLDDFYHRPLVSAFAWLMPLIKA